MLDLHFFMCRLFFSFVLKVVNSLLYLGVKLFSKIYLVYLMTKEQGFLPVVEKNGTFKVNKCFNNYLLTIC